MTFMLRRTAVAACAVISVGSLASVAVASPHAPAADKITGGSTSVTLNAAALSAMKSNHVHLTAVSPAKLKHGKTLVSPITGGTFSGLSAKVNTAGGFKITKGSKSISVSKLKSTAGASTGSGTAIVTGHGRIKAILTSAPTSLNPSGSTVTASGFTVTLSSQLVKILDKKFGTTLFKTHATIGTGKVTVKYKS